MGSISRSEPEALRTREPANREPAISSFDTKRHDRLGAIVAASGFEDDGEVAGGDGGERQIEVIPAVGGSGDRQRNERGAAAIDQASGHLRGRRSGAIGANA